MFVDPPCVLLLCILWQVMEFEVKSLLDTVNSIHEEMYYLRDR